MPDPLNMEWPIKPDLAEQLSCYGIPKDKHQAIIDIALRLGAAMDRPALDSILAMIDTTGGLNDDA